MQLSSGISYTSKHTQTPTHTSTRTKTLTPICTERLTLPDYGNLLSPMCWRDGRFSSKAWEHSQTHWAEPWSVSKLSRPAGERDPPLSLLSAGWKQENVSCVWPRQRGGWNVSVNLDQIAGRVCEHWKQSRMEGSDCVVLWVSLLAAQLSLLSGSQSEEWWGFLALARQFQKWPRTIFEVYMRI